MYQVKILRIKKYEKENINIEFVDLNKQLEDISIIEMFMGLDMLDEKTRTVALIRKKYPDYTLNELCNAYQDETGLTISKSGLHHRFKKLSEQAAQLMQMQNE